MKYSIFKKLLKKYDNDSATNAERYIVNRWYDSFDKDAVDIPGLETELDAKVTRLRIFQKINKPILTVKWYKRSWIQLAAGLLLVPAIALVLYLQQKETNKKYAVALKEQVYSTGKAEVKKMLLKDSTMIWLNANSQIRLQIGYGKQHRKVSLQGEALFEVKRDTLSPFTIDADGISVKVLGTVFNVRSYKNVPDIKVTVNSGKVQVNNAEQQLALLTVGQGITYNKSTKQFKKERVNLVASNSWTAGRIVLQKASFEELVQGMFNLYGLKLSTENKKVKSFRYNIVFSSRQSKKDVLEVLMNILDKKYKQEGQDEIVIY